MTLIPLANNLGLPFGFRFIRYADAVPPPLQKTGFEENAFNALAIVSFRQTAPYDGRQRNPLAEQ